MIQGRWFPMGADIAQALLVRGAVFGRGRDALDDAAQQVVVYNDGGEPVGSARLWWQDGAFWLGDVGVLAAERGRGYGDLLARLLIFKALTHDARELALRCPTEYEAFFARYGFKPQSEVGGEVELRAPTSDIRLSHCHGCTGQLEG